MTSILAVLGTLIAPLPALGSNVAPTKPPADRPAAVSRNDDRKDLYEVADPAVRILADSTVALFDINQLRTSLDSSRIQFPASPFGKKFGLCAEERFYEQPSGAFCSGALVGPDIMLTAGHCVPSQRKCAETAFVFGYAVSRQGDSPTWASSDEVYFCGKLLGAWNSGYVDWALIQLNRPVANHKPLAVRRGGQLASKEPLITIGHPFGLPTKVTAGGSVSKIKKDYFEANLDVTAGNAGSTVFNARTGLIEGIMVWSPQAENSDFIYDKQKGCHVPYRCGDQGCSKRLGPVKVLGKQLGPVKVPDKAPGKVLGKVASITTVPVPPYDPAQAQSGAPTN